MNFLKKRIRSFGHAFSGLFDAFVHETHLRLHFMAAVLVTAAGFYFGISVTEWMIVWLCIALVISLELVNTAIERLCNLLVPDNNEKIKFIKDVAAAAVLVASFAAFAVGIAIFWPYITKV